MHSTALLMRISPVNESGLISTIRIQASALETLQNSGDRSYCVPIPSRRWHVVQFVDPAKIADCLHVTTVLSEHELPLGRNHPHQPLSVCGKCDWERRPHTPGFRQDTHEPDSIRG